MIPAFENNEPLQSQVNKLAGFLLANYAHKIEGGAIETAIKVIVDLEAFKAYTHQRMDEAGVPSHPDGPHSAAGCRIGDRFDILVARAGFETKRYRK